MISPPQNGSPGMTLEELSSRVARELAERGLTDAQMDARISAVPDARTIRYYTTLGLLDRPEIERRQARYTHRHLLQLLAVKALQGAALPLAEIQRRLYRRTNSELEAIVESVARARGNRTAAASETPASPVKPVVWREVILEPGLRLMAADSWSPDGDPDRLEARIREAIDALLPSTNSKKRK